ncbi:MAG: AAA family ATPase [Legionellaceae bacterium]|nr:AAA family ATPase [Legionellaceae bacterium]
MYQDYFNLSDFPFNQFPNTEYYYSLENHQQSLDVLNVGLQINDGIIKITGQTGTGKSLLCRLFMEKISDNYHPVYLLNPYFTYNELLQTILSELGVEYQESDQNNHLSKQLYDKSLELKQKGKKLVLIFDEAQYISPEGLEVIQILSNFECANEKLCQIILVGGLSLNEKLEGFHHFLQRISFSYTLLPIPKEDIENYILHRLAKATKDNCEHGITFSPKALKVLYKKSRGIPRLVNITCHKALLLAYSLGVKHITKDIMKKAALDTESIVQQSSWKKFIKLFSKSKNQLTVHSE